MRMKSVRVCVVGKWDAKGGYGVDVSEVVEWSCGVRRFFFVMIRRPPRSTQGRSSAASDVYKRQVMLLSTGGNPLGAATTYGWDEPTVQVMVRGVPELSLIHISEPTRPY